MIEIMTVSELIEKTEKGNITTVYGLADAGKSSFMVSVAEKLKVLYVDTEGKFGKICKGVPSFEKYKDNISGVQVSKLSDLIEVVKDRRILSFDAIIIDSVTNLVDKELHDIMFEQKRRRNFDDYNDLGTNFMGAIEILKAKGISIFFTMQAKEDEGYAEPDSQGNLISKKAIEVSDWMFYIKINKDMKRELCLKNNIDCILKRKGLDESFPNSLIGEDVLFSSLWDVYPSKPKKKVLATKKEVLTLKNKIVELTKARGKEVSVEKLLKAVGETDNDIENIAKANLKLALEIIDKKLKK